MSIVDFNQISYTIAPQESLLQCLLRHGVDYPNSCHAGICQSCLIKAKDGVVLPSWQEGWPETLTAQCYLLVCLAKPEAALRVVSPKSAECEVNAKIISIKSLSLNVLQIRLSMN